MSEMRLRFFRSKKGDVVSRMPSGKIVLLSRSAKCLPSVGETWMCRVVEKDRFAIAEPVQRLVLRQVPRMVRFACGHIGEDDASYEVSEIWLPEDEEPEPVIRDSCLLCPKCKEKEEEGSEASDDFEKKLEMFEKKLKQDLNYIRVNSAIERVEERIAEQWRRKEAMTSMIRSSMSCDCGCDELEEIRKGVFRCVRCGKTWYKDVGIDTDVVWTRKNRGEPRTVVSLLPEPKEVFWSKVNSIMEEIERLEAERRKLFEEREKIKEKVWEELE